MLGGGAWLLAVPFFVLLLAGCVALYYNKKLGLVILALIFAGPALTLFRSAKSVDAAQIDGHLLSGDPEVLVIVEARETPAFYAALLYERGFRTVYSFPKIKTRRYPFDDSAGPARLSGVRYQKTNAIGCEKYTFRDYEALNQLRSAETYLCLSRTEGEYALASVGAEAVVFTFALTKHRPDGVRTTGTGYELRRRRNGNDELVAYEFSTDSDQSISFLEKVLVRQ